MKTNKSCAYPGCTSRMHGRGKWCPGHARLYYNGIPMRPLKRIRTAEDRQSRIEGRIKQDPKSGCWIWTGLKHATGYGYVSYLGRKYQAHRFVYETMSGEIPLGKILCHTCDNPECVNPAHMFIGTHATNAEDKVLKKRHPRSSATTCKNGHQITPENNYYAVHPTSGRKYRRCRACIADMNSRRRAHQV